MMNKQTVPDIPLAEQEELRAEMRAVMEAESLTVSDVARQAGGAYQTISAWYNGTYNGNNNTPANHIRIWLNSRKAKAEAARVLPKVPDYIETPTAKNIVQTLKFAQWTRDIAVIATASGIGKTSAIKAYKKGHPNVWIVTMDPTINNVGRMLRAIAAVINCSGHTADMPRIIGDRLSSYDDALLIIDEAQNLPPEALDQLRALFDQYGIALAIVGNEGVYMQMEAGPRKVKLAQFYSRVGMRIVQMQARRSDICALLAAWQVEGDKEKAFLKGVGAKPGALRNVTKVLQLASILAAGAEQERGLSHLQNAWKQLSAEGAEG